MKTFYPTYFDKFKCISKDCKRSCCIGWEIDIDEDTLAYYNSLQGSIGEKIKASVSYDGAPHFTLTEAERCPHLLNSGLCGIICELSEKALCDICREHPRFYNYYEDFAEAGLGLCCEAAAKIILSCEEKPTYGSFLSLPLESERDSEIIKLKDKLFSLVCKKEIQKSERIEMLFSLIGRKKPHIDRKKLLDLLFSLERFSSDFEESLALLGKGEWYGPDTYDEEVFENLTVYFLYRHLREVENANAVISFALLSTEIIFNISKKSGKDIYTAAQDFSLEIEYSEENTERLMNFFM